MKRAWFIWGLFLLSVALVLLAMVRSSQSVLELQRAEQRARQQAALEENVRLALWRMDSTLAPIVAQESVRPIVAYSPRWPLDCSPWILLRFQFGPDTRVTAIPHRKAAGGPAAADPSDNSVAQQRLARLERLTTRPSLLAMLPKPVLGGSLASLDQAGLPSDRASQEFNRRAQALTQNTAVMAQNPVANTPAGVLAEGGVVMEPLWIGDQLVLARRVMASGHECVQGCLLDWPAIRRSLLDDVKDLLPSASLECVPRSEAGSESRRLAALPVRLVPGPLTPSNEPALGPAALSLAAAWGAILLAAAAVAALLVGTMRLSQRRAAFVSAVTHELRTPLTTFQLYSEMLAEGMVPESQRVTYLNTLRSEAQRLTHLVENVLAYARLERGRVGGQVHDLSLAAFLESVTPRLADVAARAEMQLVVEMDDVARASAFRANPSSLEQILLNLVDNASKYAARAADKRIHLCGTVAAGQLELRVTDHGPGISRPALRRLFRPFARSAQEAAGSAPGVGVGLALSRRLARDMGSRLDLDRHHPAGASFLLTLPLAHP